MVQPLALSPHTIKPKGIYMRFILALILPFLMFFTIGRPFQGLICLALQLTIVGWLVATLWAVYALSLYKTDVKIYRAR